MIASSSGVADLLNQLKLEQPGGSPSPGYICHTCFKKGHFRKDCPRKHGLSRIPYTGTGSCFGEYKCPKCNREWKSGNSWVNMGQQCKRCFTDVLAYAQWEKEISIETDHEGRDPHPEQLCGKCKELGYPCTGNSNGIKKYLEHKRPEVKRIAGGVIKIKTNFNQ